MTTLSFQTYTFTQLPSGTFLFFPSFEDRTANDAKSGWATVVAYDHPPYMSGAMVGTTLHLALEDGEFRRLEGKLGARDLNKNPFVIEFELSPEGDLKQLRLDRDDVFVRSESDIRALRPNPDGETQTPARAKSAQS